MDQSFTPNAQRILNALKDQITSEKEKHDLAKNLQFLDSVIIPESSNHDDQKLLDEIEKMGRDIDHKRAKKYKEKTNNELHKGIEKKEQLIIEHLIFKLEELGGGKIACPKCKKEIRGVEYKYLNLGYNCIKPVATINCRNCNNKSPIKNIMPFSLPAKKRLGTYITAIIFGHEILTNKKNHKNTQITNRYLPNSVKSHLKRLNIPDTEITMRGLIDLADSTYSKFYKRLNELIPIYKNKELEQIDVFLQELDTQIEDIKSDLIKIAYAERADVIFKQIVSSE